MWREDPGTKPTTMTVLVGLECRHPSCVDVDPFAGLAIAHRDRRSMAAKAEPGDRKPVQRRIGNNDTATMQQPPHLRESNMLLEQPLDLGALRFALLPALAVRTLDGGRKDLQHRSELLIGESLSLIHISEPTRLL